MKGFTKESFGIREATYREDGTVVVEVFSKKRGLGVRRVRELMFVDPIEYRDIDEMVSTTRIYTLEQRRSVLSRKRRVAEVDEKGIGRAVGRDFERFEDRKIDTHSPGNGQVAVVHLLMNTMDVFTPKKPVSPVTAE